MARVAIVWEVGRGSWMNENGSISTVGPYLVLPPTTTLSVQYKLHNATISVFF